MLATRSDYSLTESAVSFWATLTLAVTAVASLVLRYVTDPVTCWTPAMFTSSHVAYTTQTCFHSRFFYQIRSAEKDVAHGFKFTYHQWLPLFLGACAVFCLLPHALWRTFNGFLWLDAHAFLQTIARNQQQQNGGGDRRVLLRDCALLVQAGLKEGNSVLALAAMGRKALVAAVSFTQLVLMATVFAPQLSGMGEEVEPGRHDNSSSIPLPVNGFMCGIVIRQRQIVMRYTVTCFLFLAHVYSKGLAFLFYLFLVLFALSLLDMMLWAGRLFVPGLGDTTVRRYLAVNNSSGSGSESQDNDDVLSRFLNSLGPDGRLLLALAGGCCGPLAATDLTNHLWAVFKGTPRPGIAPPPSSVGPAPSAASESAGGAPSGVYPMINISDKDGGDTPSADGEKEQPC